MFLVYMHTTPNGKRYIGITKSTAKSRWKNGKGYETQFFYKAIQKYGWENIKHEILFENLTKEEAEAKEVELIAFYKTNQKEYGYNVENGGSHNTCSEETKIKMSKSQKALNKTIPQWHKDILRNAQLGRKQSKETISKRVSHYKGKTYQMSEYQRRKIIEALSHRTEEQKKAQIQKAIETRKSRVYNTKKRGNNLIQLDSNGNIIKTYISISDCCRINGYDRKNIYLAIKEERLAYGFFWKKVEDSGKEKRRK